MIAINCKNNCCDYWREGNQCTAYAIDLDADGNCITYHTEGQRYGRGDPSKEK